MVRVQARMIAFFDCFLYIVCGAHPRVPKTALPSASLRASVTGARARPRLWSRPRQPLALRWRVWPGELAVGVRSEMWRSGGLGGVCLFFLRGLSIILKYLSGAARHGGHAARGCATSHKNAEGIHTRMPLFITG